MQQKCAYITQHEIWEGYLAKTLLATIHFFRFDEEQKLGARISPSIRMN